MSAGRPDFSGPKLGGFTEWSNIIGGILEVAGIEGFLSNLDQMYEKADEEGSQWEAFLLILKDHFQQEWFATTHICDMLIDNSHLVESLPDELGSPFQYDGGIDHRFKQKLGMELKKRVNTRYGSSQAYIEYQKDNHTHTAKWHVVCGDAGTCGASTTQSQNQFNFIMSSSMESPRTPPQSPHCLKTIASPVAQSTG